eukprot:CAMPEP_0170553316 /NCGR_PEP_ID=MMETSP0211-20121228/11135_1 /TAXON_ID=311385 /ORGANISM="Pseudokeronopsis sp., Strain OXSARD2" /LENGTH=40 /DNA_ID= /DNA_START= /DNA_END= /DNA_ORIENTATION=
MIIKAVLASSLADNITISISDFSCSIIDQVGGVFSINGIM